jgi:Fis family transcriptional regulator
MIKNGNGFGRMSMAAAVVSASPLLRRRVATPLLEAGYQVVEVNGPKKLMKSKRQRPYVICFFDVRGPGGRKAVAECFGSRPGERYVLVRDAWTLPGHRCSLPACGEFGRLSESFTPDEVIDWASRAATEERLAEGEQSLEELLFDRFRSFLHQLGPAPMQNLHDLVRERMERPLFKAVLEWTGGNQTRASDVLGLHRNTLRTRLKELGLAGNGNGAGKTR